MIMRLIEIHFSTEKVQNKHTDSSLKPDGAQLLKLNDSFLLDFEVAVLISFIPPPCI